MEFVPVPVINKKIVLNKLLITGTLDCNTPYVVIQEILYSHNIRFDESIFHNSKMNYVNKDIIKDLIDEIESTKVYVFTDVNRNVKRISGFFNAKCFWEEKNLIYCLNYMQQLIDNDFPDLNMDFLVGLPNNNNPYNIYGSILYRYCKKYKIKTNSKMSWNNMAKLIKNYYGFTNNDMLFYIKDHINYVKNKTILYNIMLNIQGELHKNKIKIVDKEKERNVEKIEEKDKNVEKLEDDKFREVTYLVPEVRTFETEVGPVTHTDYHFETRIEKIEDEVNIETKVEDDNIDEEIIGGQYSASSPLLMPLSSENIIPENINEIYPEIVTNLPTESNIISHPSPSDLQLTNQMISPPSPSDVQNNNIISPPPSPIQSPLSPSNTEIISPPASPIPSPLSPTTSPLSPRGMTMERRKRLTSLSPTRKKIPIRFINDDNFLNETYSDKILKSQIPLSNFNINSIEEYILNFNNFKEFDLETIIPENTNHIIALALFLYDINLSTLNINSLQEEYGNLVNKKPYSIGATCQPDIYIPKDKNLLENLFHPNRSLYSPYLTQSFHPNLTQNCYKKEHYINLNYNQGRSNKLMIAGESNNESYTKLQEFYIMNTFYHGLPKCSSNTETPISNDVIPDLFYDCNLLTGYIIPDNYNLFVSYGNAYSDNFTVYCYDEFLDAFTSYQSFRLPEKKEYITNSAINKLKLICQDFLTENIPLEMTKLFTSLLEIINTIDNKNKRTNLQGKKLLRVYNNGDDNVRQFIKEYLTKILELAMYFRGWKGEGMFPIKTKDLDEKDKDDLKTLLLPSIKFSEFRKLKYEGFEELQEMILNLSLYEYYKGNFFIYSDDGTHVSLKQKLDIVDKGREHFDMTSCIRTSSNILICTTIYYYNLLEISHTINLDELTRIY